jgi:hypothetical protein
MLGEFHQELGERLRIRVVARNGSYVVVPLGHLLKYFKPSAGHDDRVALCREVCGNRSSDACATTGDEDVACPDVR